MKTNRKLKRSVAKAKKIEKKNRKKNVGAFIIGSALVGFGYVLGRVGAKN